MLMAVQLIKSYQLGDFSLDPEKRLLCREDKPVHLATRPFQVLLYLIENRDRVVSRAELLDHFWQTKEVYEESLTKCVGAIRKALRDNLEQPQFIETRYSEGYRYIGPFAEQFTPNGETGSAIERERGVRIIIEEEIDNSLAPEAKPQTLPTLPTAVKKPYRSRRVVALSSLLAVAIISATAILLYRNSGNAATNNETLPLRSIAVLPFKNLSNDEAQEYFSDGLTETFITELAKIDGLKVISRNSVFTFKGKEVDPREVGKRLDVSAVLEGSVRRNGDSVRVDVRLVNTKDGSIIWTGDTYNRTLKDILAVQDEIACSVAAGLRVVFCREAATAKHETDNVEAYQAYLKGRYYWNKRTPEGIRRSVEHFEQAVSIDPNYALAYAGLADSYIQGVWHVPFDPKEVLPKAKAGVLQAINLNDNLAEAHTALGNIYQMEWQWSKAGKEFERAIELNPGLARAYHVQAFHLDIIGQHQEAVRAIKQAQAFDPLNMMINADISLILWHAGHHDEAITQGLKVVEMEPNFAPGRWTLTILYQYQGREKEMAEAYFKALSVSGRSDADVAAYRKAYEKKGIRGIYQKELAELLSNRAKGGYSSPIRLAQLYTLLGQQEAAFHWLALAIADHNAESAVIKQSPFFNPLRADPRFQDLLRRIGLPQ